MNPLRENEKQIPEKFSDYVDSVGKFLQDEYPGLVCDKKPHDDGHWELWCTYGGVTYIIDVYVGYVVVCEEVVYTDKVNISKLKEVVERVFHFGSTKGSV